MSFLVCNTKDLYTFSNDPLINLFSSLTVDTLQAKYNNSTCLEVFIYHLHFRWLSVTNPINKANS